MGSVIILAPRQDELLYMNGLTDFASGGLLKLDLGIEVADI